MNNLFRLGFLGLALIANLALADDATVFREPRALRLHLDKEHYFEQQLGKTLFVHNGAVYLFKDDQFGINVSVENGVVGAVKYVPNGDSADVSLRFTQTVKEDGGTLMILEMSNHTKHTLTMDGLMVVPKGGGPVRTSIIPLQAGLTNFESWPHPIAQLILHKLAVQVATP